MKNGTHDYVLTRERLPATRMARTDKFKIATKDRVVKGWITVGFFPDGRPGELFIKMDGSEFNGWTNSIGILTSLALQSGIPLQVIVDKMQFQQFEPSGMVVTGHSKIHTAKSIVDYVFRWMGHEFIDGYGKEKK